MVMQQDRSQKIETNTATIITGSDICTSFDNISSLAHQVPADNLIKGRKPQPLPFSSAYHANPQAIILPGPVPQTSQLFHLFILTSLILILPSFSTTSQFYIAMASSQYQQSSAQLPTSPQDYDVESSTFHLSAYARSMHRHTQKQLDAAARSVRRKSPNSMGTNAHGTLDTESSVGSLDSRSSRLSQSSA